MRKVAYALVSIVCLLLLWPVVDDKYQEYRCKADHEWCLLHSDRPMEYLFNR